MGSVYVKVANKHLVTTQIVGNNKSRAGRIGDPVQHADTVADDGP